MSAHLLQRFLPSCVFAAGLEATAPRQPGWLTPQFSDRLSRNQETKNLFENSWFPGFLMKNSAHDEPNNLRG
jgi:hypothetical protein